VYNIFLSSDSNMPSRGKQRLESWVPGSRVVQERERKSAVGMKWSARLA